MLQPVLDYIDSQQSQFQDDLMELLKIPSISAESEHQEDVRNAASWLVEHFQHMGLQAELIETEGHPLVYAESPPVPGAPVALVYGHYDVQPPDPLDMWESLPFDPTVRDGNIYARGASDDKGQVLTHVKSVQAWLAANEKLPLQVKFLIEGEEEVGSENLEKFLETDAGRLACDCVVISDTAQFAPDVPAITYGLKGIAYFELHLEGPNRDLHSGVFGGAVTNPANTLSNVLAALIDEEGRVQIPGFYDSVVSLTDEERQQWRELPFDEKAFEADLDVNGVTGEAGYSTLERRWARPTFDINGMTSGYQGEGAKTVLPASASAKFSFRLVPNQDPHEVAASLRKFLEPMVPPGIKMELIEYHGGKGIVFPLDSPLLEAAAEAIEIGFGKRPVFMREGGSIPIVSNFAEQLQAEVLLLGWGQNDDNLHSPNEKFSLEAYQRGNSRQRGIVGEIGSHKEIGSRQICSISVLFLDNVETVQKNCDVRGVKADVARYAQLETDCRSLQQEIEELSRQANLVSKSIGKAKDDAEREQRKEEGRTLREQKGRQAGGYGPPVGRGGRHLSQPSQSDAP